MMSHAKRSNELKDLTLLFENINNSIDEYRDGVSWKLNELHLALQRPKVPIDSPVPGLVEGYRVLEEKF